MTSSLVGSEMCIRDRKYIHQLHGTVGLVYVAVLHVARRLVDVCGLFAVSYTHLTLPTICSV
eukprot:7594671-Prorocentrum_lima.AAC.1